MTLEKSNLSEGVVFGVIGMLGYSGTLIATRVAVESFTPLTITSGRIVIAAFLAAITLIYTKKLNLPARRFIPSIVWMGIGLAVGFPFFIALALESVPAVHGAVAVGLAPAATAIIAAFRLGERPQIRFWVASAIGFGGVFYYALDAGGGHLSLADVWLLLAVLSVGSAYVEGGRIAGELGGTTTLCWSMLFLSPAALLVLVWTAQDISFPAATINSWIGMAYLGVISMFLASVFWYRGLAAGGVARIGQLNLLVPLIAIIWAAALLGEEITQTAIFCAVIVCTAMLICLRSRV